MLPARFRPAGFRPKLLEALEDYSRADLAADCLAGVTVGIVALPLAMAFAIASGTEPKAGLYTAIVAGFLISFLGGSRVQIGGPTGAFVGIVYGVIVAYGLENLPLCTVLAGIMLILMGLCRMGAMIKFIPYPVTTGFTAGIAVIILSTQINDFFGLNLSHLPADFVPKIRALAPGFSRLHWPTLALSLTSLAIIWFWPKSLARRFPGTIVSLIVGTLAVALLHLDTSAGIQTIGTRFGGIPSSLPPFAIPSATLGDIHGLFRPALTIALLAAIESLLCAVVADGMIDDRHDSNQELMAQGIANIGSAFFGGIPATGAIARTATNIKNGARSPVAGIVHALTLLVIVLAAGPLAKNIPLATLSAVLVMVAYHMGEWRHFGRLAKWPRSDALVFLTAFALTVLIDLTVAVEVGMVLAAFLFIRRISETTQITSLAQPADHPGPHRPSSVPLPEGVMVYHLVGAFFFGAADKLETVLKRNKQEPDVLILRMNDVLVIDATGLNALEDIYRKLRRGNKHLILCGPHSQPLMAMSRADFLERLGETNICGDLEAALARARALLPGARGSG